jgi:hypothetical protein
MVALRSSLLYCLGAAVDYYVSNASFGFYLMILRKYVSIGWASLGSVNNNTALASLLACLLLGISVCPDIYCTYRDLYNAVKA